MTTEMIDAANVAVLQGQLSAPPRRRELPSGSVLVEFDVTTRGSSGSCSAPVVWFEPEALAESLEEGEAVVVVGHVRRRFFRTGAGTQSRTEVVALRVLRATRSAQVRRTLEAVISAIGGGG